MMASFVPLGQFEQLKAQLEDTQESLGAALARIEVFRLREKALSAEIAKLRLGQQPDGAVQSSASDGVSTDMASTAGAAQQLPGQADNSTPQKLSAPEQPDKQQPQHQQMPKWPIPCYITEVENNLPVMLISSSSRRTPGSVVVTKDYVDFVEVRARIKRQDFVGFTAASKAQIKRSQTPSSFSATWKQFMPCLASEPSSPTHRGHKVAAAEGGKGASEGGAPPLSTSETAAAHKPHSDGGTPAAPWASAVEMSAATAGGAADSPKQSRSQAWAATSGSPSSRPDGSPSKMGHNSSALQHSSIAWQSVHDSETQDTGEPTGVWQILWRSGGMQQRLTFQATQETREFLHKHTARWLDGNSSQAGEELDVQAAAAATGSQTQGAVELAMPKHLVPGDFTPRLSEQSSILTSNSKLKIDAQYIAAALPARYQSKDWQLVYSTSRHGISLQTLYRKAAGVTSTVLLVRDAGGYVFGAFCTEPWKPSPRFFGTGETFVFQLEPHKVMYPWKTRSAMKNDFFMYAQPEALGVGGLGSFAIWLDSELLQGSSGSCGTFGSSCLASKEEFKVAAVEIWGLV